MLSLLSKRLPERQPHTLAKRGRDKLGKNKEGMCRGIIPIGERRRGILALNTAARNTMLHARVGIVDEVELGKLRD